MTPPFGSFPPSDLRHALIASRALTRVPRGWTAEPSPESVPCAATCSVLAASGSAGQPTALEREKAALAREQSALDDRAARSRTAYTRQFSALDLAVGRSRALQTYLQQQIDLWTRSTS